MEVLNLSIETKKKSMDNINNRRIVFVAGSHGTGKGYLCEKLAPWLDAQHVVASDLIRNRRTFGETKAISGIDANQSILIEELKAFETTKSIVLLDGHFCLYNAVFKIESLPPEVFRALNVAYAILLTCDPAVIITRLLKRDQRTSGFSLERVEQLQIAEQRHARKISGTLHIPLTELDVTEEPTSDALDRLASDIKREIKR
uniref:Adenylate kinase n=1 Tax=Candidatus Kentrum sp. FW TaxID=2126338 RepID=A0A450RZD8_9GAMM|nr:MAG: adenylate kinase [Candidatus Kentron sp. FW]VFJ54223.1 MAG: adenylate kinase [Candidatus Kentron sp. FW]